MVIKRDLKVEVTPTPYELAELFWHQSETQQAMFFNHLGKISGPNLCFQLQYVTDSEELDGDGRTAMYTIGEYAIR